MKLKTNEPIEIWIETCGEFGGDPYVGIKVDEYEYAYIGFCEVDDLDLDKVRTWVEETYYDGDYKCEFYRACELMPDNFIKDNKNER